MARRLLAVFAHPDDESFVNGGSLIRYAVVGVRTALVCATFGQEGKTADLCTRADLPWMREQELRAACTVLGVQDLRLFGLRDKRLASHDRTDGIRRVVAAIRELRPQVLYSFCADGWSGHTDHLAIVDWAQAAFRAAGDPAQFPTAGEPWQPARLFAAVDPLHPDRYPVHVRVPVLAQVERRIQALECHRTQMPGFLRYFHGFDRDYMRRTYATDLWQLVAAVDGGPPPGATDLWAGLAGKTGLSLP